jgi:uncharacterized protein (UPF0147 family)
MDQIRDITDLLATLSKESSISKNLRSSFDAIRADLSSNDGDIAIKIDSALQKVENLLLDPNLSSYTRMQIWNLTSLLENALK